MKASDECMADLVAAAKKEVIFHKRIYGSVEALENTTGNEIKNRRFRIETSFDQQVKFLLYSYNF